MIPWNKGKKLPPEPLSREEVQSILDRCSLRSFTGIRNRALIVLLWRSGLRCSEALSLKPKDVDLVQCSIRVLRGKGGKVRLAGIDPWARDVLAHWMQRRTQSGLSGHRQLFCTIRGDALSSSYVRALLQRLGHSAGVLKRVHPHGLRHTLACELRQEGVDVGVISKQLGHSSMMTTLRYLDHLTPADVLRTMQGRKVKDVL